MAEVEIDHRLRQVSFDTQDDIAASLLAPGPRSPRLLHPPATIACPDVRTLLEQKALVEGVEDAFFVADLGAIIRQHNKWTRLLPRVEPFYAIKCNTDPEVLRTLVPLTAGFDCASKGEIETILALGVAPSSIIFANPCKPPEHIRYARDRGVHTMTFDNADELAKVKAINPNARMVLRILTDDSKSVCRFGSKFGAHLPATLPLLQTARHLGLEVVGVSFHVGSGCQDPMAYDDAVRRARKVFDEGAMLGHRFSLLDVGGGFPGSEKVHNLDNPDIHGKVGSDCVTFEAIAAVLGPAINEHFTDPNIRVIAEPGRYYVAPAFTLATTITSRRAVYSNDAIPEVTEGIDTIFTDLKVLTRSVSGAGATSSAGGKSFMYYINDGVYGSFNCLLFDHAQAFPKVLSAKSRPVRHQDLTWLGEWSECSVWGPTCDSMDVISRNAPLPELAIGDWLYFEEMGAYTLAAASRFNGFNLSRVYYTNTETDA